jgi:arylsulfatase A-like enzyme
MTPTNRRDFLRTVGLGAAACALPPTLSAAASDRPNIIWIMADDLGYGDLSCLNENSKIQTPNLDRMAREGITFTDAHAPSAVCSPTRYGVMTGRYCFRSPLKNGVLGGGSSHLINEHRLTVPAMMKANGYQTAGFGKWHLGLDWATKDGKEVETDMGNVDFTKPFKHGPTTLGFDYYFGISASLDMPPYTYLENDRATVMPNDVSVGNPFPVNWRKGPIAPGFKHQEVLSRITEKAVGWIDKWTADKTGKPYFMYVPLTAPHTPVVPRDKFKDITGVGSYGAFVAEVDWSVQQILDAVKRSGNEQNTLVMMTSDNGPERQMEERKVEFQHFSAYHFRGHKRDVWDGGHRIPFIAKWPARVKAGSKTDELICLTDLMATCAAIVGAKLPHNAGEDSYNILPAIVGEKRSKPIREAVIHHSSWGSFAIRQGEWKLMLVRGVGDGPPSKDTSLPEGQLYNIIQDFGETNNLYEKRPEIVKRLTALLDKYLAEGRSTPGPRVEPLPEERPGSRGPKTRGGVEEIG